MLMNCFVQLDKRVDFTVVRYCPLCARFIRCSLKMPRLSFEANIIEGMCFHLLFDSWLSKVYREIVHNLCSDV
jgi:hypothetical protein